MGLSFGCGMTGSELSGLIASRICHDLISPVGAISNGLELLEMTPGAGAAETGLIRQSADAATATLKFMRIAFGAPGFEDVMAQTDVARIFVTYLNQGRRTANWEPSAGGMTRSDAQILFLAALSLADTAPTGGALCVETMISEPFSLSLVMHSSRIQALPAITEPTPRDAHHLLWDRITTARNAHTTWDVTPAEDIGLGEGYARLTVTAP